MRATARRVSDAGTRSSKRPASTSSSSCRTPRFHRGIGEFSDSKISPDGKILSENEWAEQRDQWLPSKDDGDFIASLMKPVSEPGKFANWIAPPKVGIDNKPGEFEYVKIEGS